MKQSKDINYQIIKAGTYSNTHCLNALGYTPVKTDIYYFYYNVPMWMAGLINYTNSEHLLLEAQLDKLLNFKKFLNKHKKKIKVLNILNDPQHVVQAYDCSKWIYIATMARIAIKEKLFSDELLNSIWLINGDPAVPEKYLHTDIRPSFEQTIQTILNSNSKALK